MPPFDDALEAMDRGDLETLRALLDRHPDVVHGGDGGLMWSALYHTVENRGQRDVAEMLYDRGHPVDLCFAAGLGKLDVVRSYFTDDGTLVPGADRLYRHHRRSGPQASDREIVQDALLFACVTGRAETAEYLLREQGADVDGARPWGAELPTPLHAAAWAGWRHVAELLLARGADVTIRDARHGSTPIGWAAFCGRDDVLEFFLLDESSVDLLDAFELGEVELFAKLLGDGDPDADLGPGGRGVLLRAAAFRGHAELVELLLERGADPTLANPDGKTALDWAREHGHHEVVELLESVRGSR
jgi:ankyrin repeat protein